MNIDRSFLVDEVTYQMLFYSTMIPDNVKLNIDRSTDGYTNGIIFEHKLNVKGYGMSKALSQALIYLSRFNRDGIPVPSKIMLVSQDENKVYMYDANNYIDIINDIPKYATLQASRGIDDFSQREEPIVIDYNLKNAASCMKLINIINEEPSYVKVDINIHNVYGWASYFYTHAEKPKKNEFFKEIRNPQNTLSNLINPWHGDETDFALIMDLLNDPQQQRDLGAFYTPPQYAKKATEMVREAIKNVPKGNDYIILDRCAGTGALESYLTDEELSHVIINTYELKEWHVLRDKFGSLVRCIIPPIPSDLSKYPDYDNETGFLTGANALDDSFLNRPEIMKYVNDDKCTIIMLENPPYKDIAGQNKSVNNKHDYIYNEFIKEGTNQAAHRELVNLFIWSAFKYYLKKKYDSYILFGPIKYFKTANYVPNDFSFIRGYLFNRKHFHASPSAISCILWHNNGNKEDIDNIKLEAIDIVDGNCKTIDDVIIKKVKNNFTPYTPTKKSYDGDIESSTCVEYKTGTPAVTISKPSIFNENIVGYLRVTSYNLSGFSGCLTRTATRDALEQCYGYYLRKDYFLDKLPLFCAKAFPEKYWYIKEIYFTTSDGGDKYTKDKEFLKKCLIWTSLSISNKSCSFHGQDGRFYRNELCLDGDTVANETLNYLINNGYLLSKDEENLINEYKNIINEISKKDSLGNYVYEEYNPKYSYGLFQINSEINIKIVDGYDKNGKEKKIQKYGDLNNLLNSFKKKLQKYYDDNIIDDLFKYELLK